MHNLAFNYRKATQAINFFARRCGGSTTKLIVLKLIYFADRYHLRKYGRPITNDHYWAMQFGPVASSVKEITELDSLSGSERHYAMAYLRKGARERGEDEYAVASIADADMTVFSESDIEALEFAWHEFGDRRRHLVNITHAYPEWLRHKKTLDAGQSRIRMDLADFFDDPENPSLPVCWPLTDEERTLARETYFELNRVEQLWR